MKHIQRILVFFSFFFLFILSACQSSSSSAIPIYQGSDQPLAVTIDENHFKTDYQDKEVFDATGLSVTFQGTALTSDQYFWATDSKYPDNTKLVPGETQLTSNGSKVAFPFYAVYTKDNLEYISAAVTVYVTNSQIVSPWIYYTVTAIVFVALAIWGTIQYRAKKGKR
jgi:hypothetical protein